ncbi:Protein of unknown function [Pedobacter westerhofensis]|uniref:DUF3823 domain-containing protein n=1 Tax=Pedobacter westerhofensis TaxID=425512 RepID=A0A521CZZ4_9SPHI|nr:DUF3823 domain-containing protein [Pedobacter westerhofensis]SMO64220.1 Protein of unknown function [Pedobacter westerhofensis]
MKFRFHYIILLSFVLGASSCKKDNYDAPSSTLKGRIMYNGEEIGLEYNQVPLELYQPGFGKVGAIAASFAQDGTYSTLLFDGNYKMIIPASQGPFQWRETTAGVRDTLAVTVSGNQTLDLQATPYFMIRAATYTVTGKTVLANFRADQIITGSNAKTIERINLYINKTQFVSSADNIASAEIAGTAITNPAAISLTATAPAIVPAQNYVFVRIGIKIAGVEDMIFSPLQKLQTN